ncbi:MAG: thiol peroxidase [Nitrospinota bacterium]|nr:thiol peroxidase [Nitrospinota bacterium]MDH5678291.1 thiol peroxidase [Nitrospinota bacterium]
MSKITLKGNPVNTCGALPAVGSKAPDFLLTKSDLSDVSLKNYAGKNLVINIFPSVDTAVCAASVRRFNKDITSVPDTVCLCVSLDLPFAHKRFCAAEGIENVDTSTELRERKFGEDYGVRMVDGPLAGLLSRAVVIVGKDGNVVYTQQVPDITEEPDYEKALAALK